MVVMKTHISHVACLQKKSCLYHEDQLVWWCGGWAYNGGVVDGPIMVVCGWAYNGGVVDGPYNGGVVDGPIMVVWWMGL